MSDKISCSFRVGTKAASSGRHTYKITSIKVVETSNFQSCFMWSSNI